MEKPGKKIVLYYKALVCPGGAERLLAKEYQYLVSFGYEVLIVTNRLNPEALFGVEIPTNSIKILGANSVLSIIKFASLIRSLRHPIVLCSSGHIDVFIASLIGRFQYALHIHHPCFMSFNDYDKYSMFLQRYFEAYTRSNFGAKRFKSIRDSMSWLRLLLVNIRAVMSIASIRRALCSFVLSRYAQKEKRDLYGIETEVLCGALDDDFCVATRESRNTEAIEILTLARLDVNKRIDVLIHAVALVAQMGVDIRLNVIGSGPEKNSLEQLVHKLGLSERVKLLGFLADEAVFEYYQSADLFVSIDWADYKITLFESLARGLPAIVSNETECDPLLIEKGYVTLVDPIAEDVARSIVDFFRSPALIQPEVIAPILEKYTWGCYFRSIANSLSETGLVAEL